jgi:hypothetical protein
MKRFRCSVRDLTWLVLVVALVVALWINDRRHRVEIDGLKGRARTTIAGLSYEVWQSVRAWDKDPQAAFTPLTPIPLELDWVKPGAKREPPVCPPWIKESW